MKTVLKISEPGFSFEVRESVAGNKDTWLIVDGPIDAVLHFIDALPEFEGKATMKEQIKPGKFQLRISTRSY